MKTYNLGKIEIMAEDLVTGQIDIAGMSIEEINDECISMGEGWRLPTIEEFRYLSWFHNNKLLDFSRVRPWYWTSTKEGNYHNYIADFNEIREKPGCKFHADHSSESYRARLVRSINI